MLSVKSKKMIYGKSVHTIHICFLFIKFMALRSDGFQEGCTLVCTKGDHLSQDDKGFPRPLYMI